MKKDAIKITKRHFEIEYTDKKDLFDCIVAVFGTDETKNMINFTGMVHNVLKKEEYGLILEDSIVFIHNMGIWFGLGRLEAWNFKKRIWY